MSEEKLYTDKRWTDIPWGKTADCPPPTEEERKRMDAEDEAFLKKIGVLKEDEKLEDFKIE